VIHHKDTRILDEIMSPFCAPIGALWSAVTCYRFLQRRLVAALQSAIPPEAGLRTVSLRMLSTCEKEGEPGKCKGKEEKGMGKTKSMLCGLVVGSLLTAVSVAGGSALAAEAPGSVSQAGDVYTLTTCPVSGQELGAMGSPVIRTYEGREFRFCCGGCPAKFEADPNKYTQKVDAAIIEQQREFYPLATCVVSGEKLGEMGEAVDYVYRNRLVRFCCKDCIKEFEKDPAKYIGKLNQAVIDKQKASYPLSTCPVSGDKLGGDMGEPIDYVVANRLIRLCCKGCIKDFQKDPAKYLSMLDKGQAATSTEKADPSAHHHGAKGHQHSRGAGEPVTQGMRMSGCSGQSCCL